MLSAVLLLLFLVISCREPYEVGAALGEDGFLVVDGYINIGDGRTTIKLSRTTPIDVQAIQVPEISAQIFIEDAQFTYPLIEQSPGIYLSEELELPLNRQYRLKIITAEGITYFSEYTTPIQTPPIDSVFWKQNSEGVDILVTTHDPSNQTYYYQWQYEEVWETQSSYLSLIKYEASQFLNRSNQEIKDMRTCWKYEVDKTINISSSKQLTNDVILGHTILSVPDNNERLGVRYSILIKQHALSREAHEFFEILLRNNESLGTFSDPQPSQLIGNIFRENSTEIVVGFIGTYTTETKRIFINRGDLVWRYNSNCEERVFQFETDDIPFFMNFYTPTRYNSVLIDDQPVQIGVYATLDACADCRINGGTNLKPFFWDITEE